MKQKGFLMRTVEWNYQTFTVQLIDQRILPGEFRINSYSDYRSIAAAITDMVVRGAPAIGATAGFGLALAGFQSDAISSSELVDDYQQAARILRASRPTAVNLDWAINRVLRKFTSMIERGVEKPDELRIAVLGEAQEIADEDVETNLKMAENGSVLINDGDTIIHHCNTGSLATVEWGTALGVIRKAYEQGKRIHVLVDETRPRLQGARLTAWELQQLNIPYEIICDNAAGYFLKAGIVNKVLFGADRVAANGDVANKIGSYMLALAAFDNHIPVYSVFPTSTIDFSLVNGDLIPIEERSMNEVLDIQLAGQRVVPMNAKSRNPAFDVTPHRLISRLITEAGVISPPFIEGFQTILMSKHERKS
jgi:methylthioribose-1-phosphate isomerase